MKICIKCKESKSLDLFYRDLRSADLRCNRCLDCERARRRERYKEKREHILTLAKANIQKHLAKNREKNRIRKKTKRTIIKATSCAVHGCGNEDLDFHHVHYEEPIVAITLCKQHHRMIHSDWSEK